MTPVSAADLLEKLLRCASVTPAAAEALDILENFLTPLGFTCHRLRFEGDGSYPVDNLFATRGHDGKHLLFGGHVDVVPAGREADWTHPPFAAHRAGGEIWGRGAVDMKSGVAAFCAAAARMVADGGADKGRISLAITGDEEADAVNGTEKLMQWTKSQGFTFDFALVGEPSSAKSVGDRIKNGRRGSYSGHITVNGKQGHVAYPQEARNPLPVLARLADELSRAELDGGTQAFDPSNLEITSIDTSNPASNVIPARGVLRFNIRFNDLWTGETLSAWLRERIAQIDAFGCVIEFVPPTRIAPCFVCPQGEEMALLDAVIARECGSKPEHSTAGGTSDARFIASYCKVVELGLAGARMHQTDERVPLADVETLTGLYIAFMERYFASP